MKTWKRSVDTFCNQDRERVWQETLQQISLPAARLQDHDGFHGDVSSLTSPLGIEFSRVSSSAQTLSGVCVNPKRWLWLALPLEGEFMLDEGNVALRRGDILYGPTGCNSTLRLPNPFVMLYLRIPQTILHPRLLNLEVLRLGTLSGQAAITRIFGRLLQSIVDDLDELTAEHIRPIEVAISEFVISTLAASSAMSCFDPAGASNFHRICPALELRLGDGDFNLQQLSDQQRVSARYIQKLLQTANMSFSHYLRQRRLEHIRSDLASSAHRNLSVSEICFRWGFNDAAPFSRSFLSEYCVTPRAYRHNRRQVAPSTH